MHIYEEYKEYTTAIAYAAVFLRYLKTDTEIQYVHNLYSFEEKFCDNLKRNSFMLNASLRSARLLEHLIFANYGQVIRYFEEVEINKVKQLENIIPKVIKCLNDFGFAVVFEEKGILKLKNPFDILLIDTSDGIKMYSRSLSTNKESKSEYGLNKLNVFSWDLHFKNDVRGVKYHVSNAEKQEFIVSKNKVEDYGESMNFISKDNIYILKDDSLAAGLTSFDNQLGISKLLNELSENRKSVKSPPMVIRGNIKNTNGSLMLDLEPNGINVLHNTASDISPLQPNDTQGHIIQMMQILQQNIMDNYRVATLSGDFGAIEAVPFNNLITSFCKAVLDTNTVVLDNLTNKQLADRKIKDRVDMINMMLSLSSEENNMLQYTNILKQLQIIGAQKFVDDFFN